MKIISIGYSKTAAFHDPGSWLKRISFYTGILEALAIQHQVVSFERISYEGIVERKGVTYQFIGSPGASERFPSRLHHFIKQQVPEVVLVNGFIFPLQVMQLRWLLGKKVKIFILHRAEKPFRGIKRTVQQLADRCVDGYFFASKDFGEQWIKKGIIKNRNKVHEILQSSSGFSATGRKDNLSFRVYLWVGRLERNKDPLTVVRAFKEFTRIYPAARLFMIYQHDELLEAVQDLVTGYEDHIKLVGKLPHHLLEQWYQQADFFISGSHYEGSGIAAIEAISCGCIPLLTDIDSFRSITAHGRYGLLYQSGEPEQLLEKLVESSRLDLAGFRKDLSVYFETELSFQAIARKINSVLEMYVADHVQA